MLEAIVIIVALGGLEIILWWADHKRQAEQLATLEAIWVELALLNEEGAEAFGTAFGSAAGRSANYDSSDADSYCAVTADV